MATDSKFKPTRWQPIANPTLSGWGDFKNLCYDPQVEYGDCPATLMDVLNDERIPVEDRILAFCRCSQVPNSTKRLFAVRCIRETPTADGRFIADLLSDERSINAIDVAEKFAHEEATKSDLSAAKAAVRAAASRGAAWATACDARAAAWGAAWSAAWATVCADSCADSWDAAWSAAWGAVCADSCADSWDAACADSCADSWDAAWAAQLEIAKSFVIS